MDEAAEELRKSSRWLNEWLIKNPVDEAGVPFYVPMGRTKTFEPNDIARIRVHMAKPKRKESIIYFVAIRGFIKIGWTTNWPRRLTELQISNPEKIQILLIVGRPAVYEKTLHIRFAEHRANGEWFNDHPDIRAYIAEHKGECWARARRLQ